MPSLTHPPPAPPPPPRSSSSALFVLLLLALRYFLPPRFRSGQDCAKFGSKAKKCRKAGCAFTRVNNAKYKTCTNPIVADDADDAEESVAPVTICASISGARKCRKDAACDWARATVGKKFKSCVAATIEEGSGSGDGATEEPTQAPTGEEFEYTNYSGCCRENWKSVQPYESATYMGMDLETADDKCEENCNANNNCTAYEVLSKKAKQGNRPTDRFRCELHDGEIDSASRASKSCKRATCNVKGTPTEAPGGSGDSRRSVNGERVRMGAKLETRARGKTKRPTDWRWWR